MRDLRCFLGAHTFPEDEFQASEEGEGYCRRDCGILGERRLISVGLYPITVWYPNTSGIVALIMLGLYIGFLVFVALEFATNIVRHHPGV